MATQKECIAFLGTGAMGLRMATRLIAAGYSLRVYNRTRSKTAPLVELGAQALDTPREAADGARLIISMLRDDEASRRVWLDPERGALAGMAPGTLMLESGTVSPTWLDELGDAAKRARTELLSAPVAGSRPQAEAGELVFFVGGSETNVEKATPACRAMGKAVLHTGPLKSAAVVKLVVNALFGAQVAALAEMLAMAKKHGVAPESLLPILAELPTTSPALRGIGALISAGDHAPRFPIELVQKDLHYACDPSSTPIIAAVRDQFGAACEAGMGDKNLTGIAQFYDQ